MKFNMFFAYLFMIHTTFVHYEYYLQSIYSYQIHNFLSHFIIGTIIPTIIYAILCRLYFYLYFMIFQQNNNKLCLAYFVA